MNITIIKSNPLSISFIIGKKLDLLGKINLDIIEDFKFSGENPYITGKSDVMIGDLTFFFYALEKGVDSVITSNLTRTIHLVVHKDRKITDEKLKIGVNRNGMFRLFLENNLKGQLSDCKIIWINNTFERIEKLRNKEIDGLIAINPFVDKIENEGLGSTVWSLRDTEENLVMYCFRREYYEKNKKSIKKFHEGIRKAGQIYNNMSLEEKRKFLEEDMGYEKKYIEKSLKFQFEEEGDFKEKDFRSCMEWMLNNNEIERGYDYKKYVKNLGV